MSNLIARAGPKYYKCFMLDARKEAVDEIERLNDLVALQKKDMKIAMDRIAEMEAENAAIKKFIDAQAEDEGLWFVAQTAPEAYVQRGLRSCHAYIEEALQEADDE